jgi:hypothetical protein
MVIVEDSKRAALQQHWSLGRSNADAGYPITTTVKRRLQGWLAA